jgi:DNA-binding GntR family transcriptional regulator
MVLANAQLHRLVTELSGNQVLLDFVVQVDRRVRWYYTPVARQRGKKSWEEHAKLISAIENGDADTASKIMREHTERTRQTYLEHRDEKSADEPAAATPIRARRRRVAPRPR